ncbi:MAG: GNAT family N-acetyltransferase [Ferruginibacter sp.]
MICYRLANKADNQQLISLAAASGMVGETSLRIDRNPDFFKLLEMRGETKAFLALDGDKVIGSLCVSYQLVYVSGTILPLYYIGDFKVAAAYRNKGIGLRLCDDMASYLVSVDADLVFLNVSKGNTKPISFFKNRPNVPDYDNIGIFNIHQFAGKKRNSTRARYTIEPAVVTDQLVHYLNAQYCKYELGPVITEEKLAGTTIFIVREKNNIIAAMCLSDTMNVKQNVVTRLSWKMKWLLRFINTFHKFTGISKMPGINQPVRMMYIKYLAVDHFNKGLVQSLINHARNIVYEKSYSFVSIGLHEKDPLNSCFSGLLKLTFNSVGMLLSIKDNRGLIEKVLQGVPFEDYSLV